MVVNIAGQNTMGMVMIHEYGKIFISIVILCL